MAAVATRDVSELIDSAPVGAFQKRAIALCALVAILDRFDTQSIAFVAPVIVGQWALDPVIGGTVLALGWTQPTLFLAAAVPALASALAVAPFGSQIKSELR